LIYIIRLLLVQNKRLYIGYTEVDAEGRGLDIKEIGDIFNRFLEKNKAKIKGEIYDKVYREKDKWVAFWWYALVDNLFTNKNIENVLNYYENLLNIIKKKQMTKSIILEINPKIKVLYYLSAVTIMGNYSYEQELFALDKDAFNSYTNEINKYYKDVRLLSLLSDYYKKNDVESIPGFILITYSSYPEKLSREKLEGLGHLISAGFHIDVALNDNNQIKRERISDWGIVPLPISIKAYMECVVSELINKVYENGRNSDDDIFGITIGKFVPELKGEVSISANYLLNKRYEISEDDIFLLFDFSLINWKNMKSLLLNL